MTRSSCTHAVILAFILAACSDGMRLKNISPAAIPLWGQCGGKSFTGSGACVAGTTCVKQNEWHSQCQKSAPTATTTPTQSPTTSTSVPTSAPQASTYASTSGPQPSTTPLAPSSTPLMPATDKKELFSALRRNCVNGEWQIIEEVFASQHDDAVCKELLMAKTTWCRQCTLLGVTMDRLSDDEYDGTIWEAQVKHVMLVLAKLHVKYDVPLDAKFNGFYQLDRFRHMDVKLYLEEFKIEFVANSYAQILDGFTEQKQKLELGGTFITDTHWSSWKVTDATGRSFTPFYSGDPFYSGERISAFPVKVEILVRNGAR